MHDLWAWGGLCICNQANLHNALSKLYSIIHRLGLFEPSFSPSDGTRSAAACNFNSTAHLDSWRPVVADREGTKAHISQYMHERKVRGRYGRTGWPQSHHFLWCVCTRVTCHCPHARPKAKLLCCRLWMHKSFLSGPQNRGQGNYRQNTMASWSHFERIFSSFCSSSYLKYVKNLLVSLRGTNVLMNDFIKRI